VSPRPFVAFVDDLARAEGSIAAVLRRIGWDDEVGARRLYRWRTEVAHVEALDVYDLLHLLDGSFDAVYSAPEYSGARAAMSASPEPVAGRRRGKPVGKHRRMTDAQVRAAHVLYQRKGLSLRQLGRALYEQLGYGSAASCANALSDAFLQLGLPTRDRVAASVAASTKHGLATRAARASSDPRHLALRRAQRRARGETLDRPRCAGVRLRYPRKGEPCGRLAQAGSDFCLQHDPTRREDVVAAIEHARAAAIASGPKQEPQR
jgi:hypothetical protein